jgi:hypothetical protein
MTATLKKVLNLKDHYDKSRNDILTKIIVENNPDSEINITNPFWRSTITLGEYVTLDFKHKMDINLMKQKIRNYASDKTRRRPLNFIMIAKPGSGKSHFIKCLAESMSGDHISAINFNMANKSNIDDLSQPLEAVRNLKVTDRTPILFLDEFDSSSSNYSVLLPLLWDGEFHLGHRELKLGKVIIILAGSNPTISEMIKKYKSLQNEIQIESINDEDKKIVDLLSRINGGLFEVPGLEVKTKDRDRRVDKVCIALSLLSHRFGPSLHLVPWNILHFIGNVRFQYGVRSIENLIDIIPLKAFDSDQHGFLPNEFNLPLDSLKKLEESSLAYHLVAVDEPKDIIELWENISNNKTSVRFKDESEEEF